jgi:hypothetical protein
MFSKKKYKSIKIENKKVYKINSIGFYKIFFEK